jgi:N-acetylglucosamine-6-phosphate deacetylase
MTFALTGAQIFTGSEFINNYAVIIVDGIIKAVTENNALDVTMPRHHLSGGFLAPGFIDIQVNGGGGALLNSDPHLDGVKTIAKSHRRHGTTGLLPTVITDERHVMISAIEAVRAARQAYVPGILGIHIEGPFLDPARRGAHPERHIRPLDETDLEILAQSECGRILLTVSPSQVPPETIRRLTDLGIAVSLGHSDATYEQTMAALAAGAKGFTHLFNAMSQMTNRAPGMVGAGLTTDSYCGIIADGHHVHPASLRAALAVKGSCKLCLVTDAMPTAAGGPDRFLLQGREVIRINGKLTLEDGTLAGSDLTMDAALRYAVQQLNVPLSEALCMASANPAAFIGLDCVYGKIAQGYCADLVHLDAQLRVQSTWISGLHAEGEKQ